MSAYAATFSDLTATLAGCASPITVIRDGQFERAICDGERIGWFVESNVYPGEWKWSACGTSGYETSRAACIKAIERLVPEWRAHRATERAYRAEIDAMGEPLRSLAIERDRAALRLEIERARTVRRPDDLLAAEEAYRSAVMAFDAAERAKAEAA